MIVLIMVLEKNKCICEKTFNWEDSSLKNVQNNALIMDVVTVKQGHLHVLVLFTKNYVIYTNVNQMKLYPILKVRFIKVLYVRIRFLT